MTFIEVISELDIEDRINGEVLRHNSSTTDVDKLLAYSNKAFLKLVAYMDDVLYGHKNKPTT